MNIPATFMLITGASMGLGRELAIQCAKRSMNLILVALPDHTLESFSQMISEQYSVQVHFFETDLTVKSSIYQLFDWIIKNKFEVFGLINNAGIGEEGRFNDCTTSSIDYMIKLNVRAPAVLTHLLEPLLRKNKKAYILNIASMAAYCPIPYKTAYPASKVFIYNFSRCLCEEYIGTGIHVCVVTPGPMETNSKVTKSIVSKGYFARLSTVSPKKIAEISIKALLNGQKVVVPGFFNKFNLLLIRTLPPFILNSVLGRYFRVKN